MMKLTVCTRHTRSQSPDPLHLQLSFTALYSSTCSNKEAALARYLTEYSLYFVLSSRKRNESHLTFSNTLSNSDHHKITATQSWLKVNAAVTARATCVTRQGSYRRIGEANLLLLENI